MAGICASVAEHAVPGDAVGAQDLPLGLLIAPRDASRVTLRRLHPSPPARESPSIRLGRGALPRPTRPFAVRRHRSSIRVEAAFTRGYHVAIE